MAATFRSLVSVGFFLISISRSFSALPAPDVSLVWDPSPDATVVGYRLHSGTASGIYTEHLDVGAQTSTAVTGLVRGDTYYFAVTAYTADGIESDPSNEISFTLPPALQPALRLARKATPNDPARVPFQVTRGRKYLLEASGDLLTWTNLAEVVATPEGWIRYTDTNSSSASMRFYRLQSRFGGNQGNGEIKSQGKN